MRVLFLATLASIVATPALAQSDSYAPPPVVMIGEDDGQTNHRELSTMITACVMQVVSEGDREGRDERFGRCLREQAGDREVIVMIAGQNTTCSSRCVAYVRGAR